MTTGEKLQNLRKENNYTQEELADIVGVSRQSISKWESDIAFPETDKLILLSKLYHCSIDYLLNDENNERTANVVMVDNKETTVKKPYNKKRLPLTISTISTYLLSLLLFFPTWFTGEYTTFSTFYIGDQIGYNTGPTYQVACSFYDLLKINGDSSSNGCALKVMAIITLIYVSMVLATCILYMYLDKKPFKFVIRISNCLFLGLITTILIIGASSSLGFTITTLFEYILVGLLVLLQYAVKPIRVTY